MLGIVFKYNEESTNLNANKNIKNFYIDIKFYKYYINIYKKKKNINYYFNFIKIIYYIYY